MDTEGAVPCLSLATTADDPNKTPTMIIAEMAESLEVVLNIILSLSLLKNGQKTDCVRYSYK